MKAAAAEPGPALLDDVWWPTQMRWEHLDLTVDDDSSAGGSRDPDGLADSVDIRD